MKTFIKTAAVSAALVLLLTGCHGKPHSWFGFGSSEPVAKDDDHHGVTALGEAHGGTEVNSSKDDRSQSLTVDLIGMRGTAIGKAKLTPFDGGVHFEVDTAYLPEGPHGFHVHENGKCAAPDFQTAGGHFNPFGKKHGGDNPEQAHAGDLPNLEAGKEGKVKAAFVSKLVTLEKDKPNSLLKPGGTALVIHERGDDYKTDPSGNSGARIACGVIQ